MVGTPRITAVGTGAAPWRRPMAARDPAERHRASTPLELLFDLCFVVAVAQAAGQLHHGLADGHVAHAVGGYAMAFFAIWWAWVNFTWFASAYDTDDVPYRLLTLLQIAGVLVLAAGIPDLAEGHFVTATLGYVIMRVALIAQWLRAAAGDPAGRPGALRYAAGVGAVQVAWLVRLALPDSWSVATFVLLAAVELAVPVWAEYRGSPTSWHPGHITERYGLFTLIVLGECVSAATVAVQASTGEHGLSAGLLVLAGGALVLVFGLWWSYFKHDADDSLQASLRTTMVWAYSHYAIFAAVAALGAGLEVAVERVEHVGEVPLRTAAFAVAVPVAVFLAVGGSVQLRTSPGAFLPWPLTLVGAAVVLLLAAVHPLGLPGTVVAMAAVVCALLAANLVAAHRTAVAGEGT
jgi:low temperature requirement protein LtrA